MTSDSSDDRRRFGEYEIETLIGRGSIGKVYLARHRRIGRRAALKVIDTDQPFEDEHDRNEFYRRLQREAELCGALQHPNIVTLYDAGYEGDVVSYLATEYIAGESLQSRLKRTRPLPLAEGLSIAADLLRGLGYAHAQGVIHRDIKPANLMISTEGHAKITDFGIARPIDSSLTGVNSLLGTPNYMSPEQVKSTSVTTRSDLFSAGVVMYEMLTGVRPFAAQDLSGILFNVVNLDPPLASDVNPAVPRPVAMTVAKLLAKSPADRFATASEALLEVEAQRAPLRSALEYATIGTGSDTTTPLSTAADGKPPGNVVAGAPKDEAAQRPRADESTTVAEERPLALIRHAVSAGVFLTLTLVLLASFTASVVFLQSRIRAQRPQAVITQEQHAEDVQKRRDLRVARSLVAAGRYDAALVRYDAYLAKYPASVTARSERAKAKRLLDGSTRPGTEVTTTAKKKGSANESDEEHQSRWDRFKKRIRGK